MITTGVHSKIVARHTLVKHRASSILPCLNSLVARVEKTSAKQLQSNYNAVNKSRRTP